MPSAAGSMPGRSGSWPRATAPSSHFRRPRRWSTRSGQSWVCAIRRGSRSWRHRQRRPLPAPTVFRCSCRSGLHPGACCMSWRTCSARLKMAIPDGHGPIFLGLYVQLLVRYMRLEQTDLLNSLHDAGLRVAPDVPRSMNGPSSPSRSAATRSVFSPPLHGVRPP